MGLFFKDHGNTNTTGSPFGLASYSSHCNPIAVIFVSGKVNIQFLFLLSASFEGFLFCFLKKLTLYPRMCETAMIYITKTGKLRRRHEDVYYLHVQVLLKCQGRVRVHL